MSEQLAIAIEQDDDITRVRLSGVLDEDNGLLESVEEIAGPHVVIHTADVEKINSYGVRDWVTWLGELEGRGLGIHLVECSPAVMTQVNLVGNFLGSGSIVNFFAPYFCHSCDTDKMLLVDAQEARRNLPFRAPTCRCDQCDHTMEFDDIEDAYFGFLHGIPERQLDPGLAVRIKGHPTGMEGRLRARNTMPMPAVTSTTSPSGVLTSPSGLFTSPSRERRLTGEAMILEPIVPPQPPRQRINRVQVATLAMLAMAIVLLLVVALGSM